MDNMITNCPISIKNVTDAYKICGTKLAEVHGKRVKKKQNHIITEYVSIPKDLYTLYNT